MDTKHGYFIIIMHDTSDFDLGKKKIVFSFRFSSIFPEITEPDTM